MARHKTIRIGPAQTQVAYRSPRTSKVEPGASSPIDYDSDQELADLGYGSEDEVEVGVAQIGIRVGPGTAYPIRIVDIAPRRASPPKDVPLRRVDGMMDLRSSTFPVLPPGISQSNQYAKAGVESSDRPRAYPVRVDSAIRNNLHVRDDPVSLHKERRSESGKAAVFDHNIYHMQSPMCISSNTQLRRTAEDDEKLLLYSPGGTVNTQAEPELVASQFPQSPSPEAIQKRLHKLRNDQARPMRTTSLDRPVAEEAADTTVTSLSPHRDTRRTLSKGKSRSKKSIWPLSSITNRWMVREVEDEASSVTSEQSTTASIVSFSKDDSTSRSTQS